jgi:hypothetical protein
MKIEERNRAHIENHIRTVEQQILDVLLRIEELLTPRREELSTEPSPTEKKRGRK